MAEVKEIFHWAGYYADTFARRLGKDHERCTRPLKWGGKGFAPTKSREILKRIQCAAEMPFLAFFSVICLPLSLTFRTVSWLRPGSRLHFSKAEGVAPETVTVLYDNFCFQEAGFSTKTGGVEEGPARIAAAAAWIAKQKIGSKQSSPDIICGQEGHDPASQKAFKKELKKQGYTYFVFDRSSHPVCMNSGLFFAFKRIKPLSVSFTPYPLKDRRGLALLTEQGALRCEVRLANGKILKIFNTHLNYGDGPKNQAARNLQLQHVLPDFQKGYSVLGGDFNFDTSKHKEEAGLSKFTNHVEGIPTCTNEGAVHYRGEAPKPDESIDALYTNQVEVRDLKVQKMVGEEGSLLSDHFAITAELVVS